ncbi:cytochrome P450 [Archangium violaceum]|uniref:cytochrome P450 n=1 Tax=Archangium violaceum TaxID=83451 RepID=UPI00193C0AE4|nr:cytochrome P450 [Archangium violaceum]QRK05318.1 cytochrome P450 [Archangium violaceum]
MKPAPEIAMLNANVVTSPRYEFFSPEAIANSQSLLSRIRSEDPVHFSDQLGGWLVTRYADVMAALKDPRFLQATGTGRLDAMPEAARQQLRPLRDSIRLWMGNDSTEDHLRFQRILKKYFTPGTLEALRPRIQELTTELVDAARARGRAEVVSELAYPLPANVIAEMLGVPTKDRELLQRWSRDLLPIFTASSMEQLLQSQKSVLEMTDYMRPIVEEHRREPRQDLISVFLAEEAAGNIRDVEEIAANCVLLLFAGHETTANLICNGLSALFDFPDQLELLRAKPELMQSAVEEMLRFSGIGGTITRVAGTDLELGGKKIAPRQLVFVSLASANHDPEVFPEPSRFDITRKTNKHVTFGYGSYYCLGAALARLEAQVFFSTFLPRFPNLRLVDRAWEPSPPLGRRLTALNVSF